MEKDTLPDKKVHIKIRQDCTLYSLEKAKKIETAAEKWVHAFLTWRAKRHTHAFT